MTIIPSPWQSYIYYRIHYNIKTAPLDLSSDRASISTQSHRLGMGAHNQFHLPYSTALIFRPQRFQIAQPWFVIKPWLCSASASASLSLALSTESASQYHQCGKRAQMKIIKNSQCFFCCASWRHRGFAVFSLLVSLIAYFSYNIYYIICIFRYFDVVNVAINGKHKKSERFGHIFSRTHSSVKQCLLTFWMSQRNRRL